MSAEFKGKSYNIFADNFFSSILFAKDLLDDKIGYCGTIRRNRIGLPEFAPDKNMKRGEYDCRMDSSGVSITKWKDNKGAL